MMSHWNCGKIRTISAPTPGKRKIRSEQHAGKKDGAARLIARAVLPTRYGLFLVYGFSGSKAGTGAIALVCGRGNRKTTPLVRIHSQCLTGDVLTSLRCDCRAQLEFALKEIGQARSGVLLYLPQEGRGIGLMNKLRAYELQDRGMDTVEANERLGFPADPRDYGFSAQVLKRLGMTRIRLLSNNPEKARQLERSGIRIIQLVPCRPRVSRVCHGYLRTKKHKMGHLLGDI